MHFGHNKQKQYGKSIYGEGRPTHKAPESRATQRQPWAAQRLVLCRQLHQNDHFYPLHRCSICISYTRFEKGLLPPWISKSCFLSFCLFGVGGVGGIVCFFISSWFSQMVSKPFIMLACHPLLPTDSGQIEIIDQVLESHLCCCAS